MKKQQRKNIIGKEMNTMLKKSIAEKGLVVEDILELLKFDEEFYTNNDAVNELRQSNLMRLPPYNRCIFIDGNSAKIEKILNKDVDGEEGEGEEEESFTYYYKSWNDETQFRLDILGAYRAFSNKTYSEMMSELMTDYGIETDEEKWKALEKARYRKNIEMLEDKGEWLSTRPNLYKVIKSSLKTLRCLNVIAIENMISIQERIENKSVFFASESHILTKYSTISQSSRTAIRTHANLLSAIRIIRKPKIEELPTIVQSRSEMYKEKSGFNTNINYFLIETLNDEILDRAEEISKELVEKKTDINHLTMETLEEALGKDAANGVYGNNANNTLASIKGVQKRKMEMLSAEDVQEEVDKAKLKMEGMPGRDRR